MTNYLIFIALGLSAFASHSATNYGKLANKYHQELVTEDAGIGAREAGTKQERTTASYITEQFKMMGYSPINQTFTFGDKKQTSSNIIINTHPDVKKTVVLGAHYDSTAQKTGSLGATDNGAGVAALLAIAKALSDNDKLNYNVRLIAFGAEEVGLHGSKFYVSELSKQPDILKNIIAMINFDTIAGGDYVYVHSAHTSPYKCDGVQENYNSDTHVRDALLKVSSKVLGKKNQYVIHPEYPGYPEGVTGSWSDHAPYACAGIPIAYVESTNFTINGKDGFDGYSQTTNEMMWDCYDQVNKTACNRDSEKKWGNIWHSQFDRLDKLETVFPGRVQQQIANNVSVLVELFTHHIDKLEQ